MLYINTENKIGAKIEPCGTPLDISMNPDVCYAINDFIELVMQGVTMQSVDACECIYGTV